MRREFKIGDRVRVKKNAPVSSKVLGKTGTVVEKSPRGGVYCIDFDAHVCGHDCGGYAKEGHGWNICPDYLELISEKRHSPIVIYQEGQKVIALDKETGLKGVSRCSADDEFDFLVGARIAYKRLMGELPKPEFKVGDRVQIREWDDMASEYGESVKGIANAFVPQMKPLCGRTATISIIRDCTVDLNFDDKSGDTRWAFTDQMIRHTSVQAPKPKYYSGKAVCVKNTSSVSLTVGKIYEFKRGLTKTDEYGAYFPGNDYPAETLESLNGRFPSIEFLEVVE